MSSYQLPKYLWVKTLDDNEECFIAQFRTSTNCEVRYLRPRFFIHGFTSFTTEKFRLKIYSDDLRTKILYTTDWRVFSDISNFSGNGHWFIPVTCDYFNLNKNTSYYASLEISGYTRNGDTSFISVWMDSIDIATNNNTNIADIRQCTADVGFFIYD